MRQKRTMWAADRTCRWEAGKDKEEPSKKRVRERRRGTQEEKQAPEAEPPRCKKGHTMGQRTDNPPAYKNEACCDVCGREHLAKLCTKQSMPRTFKDFSEPHERCTPTLRKLTHYFHCRRILKCQKILGLSFCGNQFNRYHDIGMASGSPIEVQTRIVSGLCHQPHGLQTLP
ncbi:unnamed protein product [Symbiodinium sp. CCMP2592]|nr:unnamed protein product [Symbiodinium sp. CCMP2592]